MRMLHVLMVSVWRQFLEWMAWRAFLFTLVMNQAIAPLLGLAVWSVALPGSSTIPTYYTALLVVQLLTASYEHHTLSNGIYAGELSHELLKPQPVVIGPLGTNIALRIWHLLAGLPLMVIVGVLAGVRLDGRAILLAVPALVLAAVQRFLFTYLLALSAFWSEQAHGLVGFGEILIFLLGGEAAPITLFPAGIRPLGEALPFRGMLGFPAEIASHSLGGAQILAGYGWQVLWGSVLAGAAVFVWRLGVQRYTAIGG